MALTPDQEIEYLLLKKKQSMAGGTIPAEPSAPSPGFDVPPSLQAFSKALTAPGRVLRGLGITAEQLIAHPTEPSMAPVIGAMASRPGWQPQGFAQGATSLAAGMADPLNQIGKFFPAGTLLKSLAGGAAAGSGLNLMDQAAQGHVNLPELGWSAAAGGTLGAGIHGAAAGIRTGANKLVKDAPGIFKTLAGIPETLTEHFKKNPNVMDDVLPTTQARQELIEEKSGEVGKGVKDLYNKADQYWKAAATKAGVRQSAAERSQLRPIPSGRIAQSIDSLKPVLANAGRLDEASQRNVLKTLLHIRQSIDHYNGTGIDITGKPLMNAAKSGLSELRKEVNGMIEQLPGGEVIRDADRHTAPIYDLVDKLGDKFKRIGEASEWLRKTLAQEGPNAKEDMQHLIALEKISGKPIIHELTDAATKAAFAPKLADNQIKRSLAGASPFLISAFLRILKVPFQASLPAAALTATVGQSPAALGGALRWAQNAEPSVQKVAKGSAVAGLNAIRKFMEASR